MPVELQRNQKKGESTLGQIKFCNSLMHYRVEQ